jgi:hypothetical protein
MPQPAWTIVTSERFRQDQSKANAELARLIDSEVVHLAERAEQRPTLVLRDYTLRKNTKVDVPILEIEVGGGFRMLAAHFEGRELCLLMSGAHDTVYREFDGSQKVILNRAQRSREPYRSTSQHLAGTTVEQMLEHRESFEVDRRWAEELTDQWVYFLDDTQADVATEIADAVIEAVADGKARTLLLLGGPGTGKTAILLRLMSELDGLVRLSFSCSPRLGEYLGARTSLPIAEWRSSEEPDVVVIDDPRTLFEARPIAPGPPVRVVAMDLLQLAETPDDATVRALLNEPGVAGYKLEECYRQKEEVGAQALEVSRRIAASTPFLSSRKVERREQDHALVHELSLSLRFTNPAGVFVAKEACTESDVAAHAAWLEAQALRWDGWPPIAVVVDDEPGASDLADAFSDLPVDLIPRHRIEELIKGLDYDHVVLLLGAETYRAAFHGFAGSGTRRYEEYRKLRIPFTRARDSLAVFGVVG